MLAEKGKVVSGDEQVHFDERFFYIGLFGI